MLLTVFENAIFIQALAWAIANSLWQVAALWLIYKLVAHPAQKSNTSFRYNVSLAFQFGAFVWFIYSIALNYSVLSTNSTESSFAFLFTNKLQYQIQWVSYGYFIILPVHCYLLLQQLRGVRYLQQTEILKPSLDIKIFAQQTAFKLGIKKEVLIGLSKHIEVPCVTGFIKPIVLLPFSTINNLSTEQAYAIIMHELAHIKRNDCIVNLCQAVIETVMCFNPFVKLLGNIARVERENCCDDYVMNFQFDKKEYATALLLLEQNRLQQLQLQIAATNGEKKLLARIKRLFAEERSTTNSINKLKLGLSSVLILFLFSIVGIASNKKEVAGKENATAKPMLAVSTTIKSPEIKKQAAKENNVAIVTVKANSAKQSNQSIESKTITVSFVNKELLKQKIENKYCLASNTDLQNPIAIIEEEHSGSSDKIKYIVELNNCGETINVTPIAVVHKIKAPSIKNKKSNKKIVAKKVKPIKNRVTT